MAKLTPHAPPAPWEERLTEPDSEASGVTKYDCQKRVWRGFAWRNMRLLGMSGMKLQSPNRKLTRVAVLLENREARAQFRLTPAAPTYQRDALQSMCFVPAGDTVWVHSERGGALEFSSVAFDAQELSALLGKNIAQDVLTAPMLDFWNERIWQYASRLQQESRDPGEHTTLYCESVLMALLIEVLRLKGVESARPTRGGLSHRQLKQAKEFIEENLCDHISLSELAELTGLSVSHFSHAFKQSTGMPPHRWQLQARIRRAQELLTSTTLALRTVALTTGFADQAHFTRVFRRVAGVTPRVWQRERV